MSSQSTMTKPIDVLVVEDSPTQAEQLKYLLGRSGYTARVARNGAEALVMAEECKPTLIISDVVMPEMNGYQLCREVKSRPGLKDLPIILVTALASPQDVIKGLECGADNFIRKPYTARELLARINYILTNQNVRAGSKVQAGVQIAFGEETYFITADRQQILDLLITTYDDAVSLNGELQSRQAEIARSNQLLHGLYRIAEGVNRCESVREVLEKSLELALELPGIQAGWVSLWHPKTGFRLAAARNLPPALEPPAAWKDDCLCRQKMLAGELDRAVNTLECERLRKATADTKGLRYHASIPLRGGNRTLGVLNLAGPDRGMFEENDFELLDSLGNQIGLALERAELLEELESRVEERTAALETEFAERRRAEAQLHRSEVRFRRLVESNLIGVMAAHLDGRFLDANDAFLRMVGYTREDLESGRVRWSEMTPPEYRELDAKILAEIKERGVSAPVEKEYMRKDGSRVPVLLGVAAVDGSPGEINCFALDLTEHKRAEESNRRLAAMVESSQDAIIGKNLDGVVVSWNRGAERLYGYSAAEMMGHPVSILVPPGQRDDGPENIEKIKQGESIRKFETTRIRKDGKVLTVSVSVSPVLDARGIVIGVSTITHDITDRKQLEDQLRQAQKMEAVGRLAGGVAHDFNNLLTVISGRSYMVHQRLKPDAPERESIEEIIKAGDRAATLTRQLLAFSRQQVLQPRVIDLNSVVADLGKLLRRLIGEDIELVTIYGKDLGQVKADPGQIEQLIMNLAVNSRDAMPRGGRMTIETANIDLDGSSATSRLNLSSGPYVMLAVGDTGVGMDEETKSRIFEPFFTTKEQGRGTGLGLSTVYGIIKQSDGSIEVSSEPNRGTTFKIYLPQVDGIESTVQAHDVDLPARTGGETILLVEDEDPVRALTLEILRSQGYKVLEAESGLRALQISQKHEGPIHLLLTDVVMPGMSGRELAKRLAPLRPTTKVLYMSGYTDEDIVRHGVLKSGGAFIQKPFSPDSVVRKAREVLDSR